MRKQSANDAGIGGWTQRLLHNQGICSVVAVKFDSPGYLGSENRCTPGSSGKSTSVEHGSVSEIAEAETREVSIHQQLLPRSPDAAGSASGRRLGNPSPHECKSSSARRPAIWHRCMLSRKVCSTLYVTSICSFLKPHVHAPASGSSCFIGGKPGRAKLKANMIVLAPWLAINLLEVQG